MHTSRWAPKPEAETPPEPAPPTQQAEPPAPAAPEPKVVDPPPPPADMPYDYNYADSSIDPFAQTAGTDDLFFDDDFTPVAEEAPIEVVQPEPVPDTTIPAGGLGQSQYAPRGPANGDRGGRGRGRGRDRGRGRGRGGSQAVEARDPKEKPAQEKDVKHGEAATDAPATTTPAADTTETPSTPAAPKESKSVRGDRTLTGGTPRARLTEAQINEKLATMKSKNEALVTAHARAEADQANFEAREALAAQKNAERKKQQTEKQKAERQNRQQMMGEREKNRQRKLNALDGREWDMEKESGFEGTGEERRRGPARGAHGGVTDVTRTVGDADQQHQQEQVTPRGRGRGRGGQGGRGGRGDHQGAPKKEPEAQNPPSASDFPELPSTSTTAKKDTDAPKKLDFPIRTKTDDIKAAEPERPGIKKQDSFGLPSPVVGSSWADQVDDS